MNKAVRTLGQIFMAVGLTLTAGGIASFHSDKVELLFFGKEVISEQARILWISAYSLLAILGLLLLFLSRKKRNA